MTSTVECCVPLTSASLSPDDALAIAGLFRALSDPARVRIVHVLATSREPVCACEFEEPLALAQPTVSHHLRKLLEAGLVEREQRGKWAYYSLKGDAAQNPGAVADLRGACC